MTNPLNLLDLSGRSASAGKVVPMLSLREKKLVKRLEDAVSLIEALMQTETWNSLILKDCKETLQMIENEEFLLSLRKAGM